MKRQQIQFIENKILKKQIGDPQRLKNKNKGSKISL